MNWSEYAKRTGIPEKILRNQRQANDAYSKLISSFAGRGKLTYPENYGGAYIKEDGRLAIYSTDADSMAAERLLEAAGDGSVEVIPAEYSYRRLTELMNRLGSYVSENRNAETIKNIAGFGIDDSANRVIIRLIDCSDSRRKDLEQCIGDLSAVRFVQADGCLRPDAALSPGEEIKRSNGYVRTIGYAALLDTQPGIVTAAHNLSLGEKIYKEDTEIGECSVLARGGSVDAAFCKITNGDYTPENKIVHSLDVLSKDSKDMARGSIISMRGASSGLVTGRILAANVTVQTKSGIWLNNMVMADYAHQPGDSGAPVYCYQGPDFLQYTLGIHTGGTDSAAYYCKAAEVDKALGTVRL